MAGLTSIERDAVAPLRDAPLLAQVHDWAAVNSGTRNLVGLGVIAAKLADAFAVCPDRSSWSNWRR